MKKMMKKNMSSKRNETNENPDQKEKKGAKDKKKGILSKMNGASTDKIEPAWTAVRHEENLTRGDD
ncbi:hypothetical protein [Pleomorphovibrio marinus]|uniref:hypothetical protein n=1 Tax=Pleomorphovibrio marinus TaxID=2164132 RepID=UPI000E0C6389|nr:hypothetical protein [Pleomorphovibrio marinus]